MQEQRIQRIRQERNKLLQKEEKKLIKKVVKLKQFDIINNTKYISNVILL
jgi:acyl-ACP thioesterase